MFKAPTLIHCKPYENIKIHNSEGKVVTEPNEIIKLTTEFFRKKFVGRDAQHIHPYKCEPRPLNNPITPPEIHKCFKKLNNNQAVGPDGMPGELYKYCTPLLAHETANCLNSLFETHENINLSEGEMISQPKPGKPNSPVRNLRPLTLLSTIRKTLSLICIQRIRPAVTKYISSGQSGFQSDGSTADVVWSHRWLAAKCSITQELKVTITGIDMSAAFDTINRTQLLDILENIIEEDELRIIRFLLSNTKINMKVNGATEHHSFLANTGTPQGDGLSPVLFIIYLENALRDIPKTQEHKDLRSEITYADDVDCISLTCYSDIEKIHEKLRPHQLNVNTDKTEYTCIERKTNRSEENWRTIKKVGFLIGEGNTSREEKHFPQLHSQN